MWLEQQSKCGNSLSMHYEVFYFETVLNHHKLETVLTLMMHCVNLVVFSIFPQSEINRDKK